MSGVHRPVAVLDTNVLIPQMLRDVLLRCAAAHLYRVHWSVTTIEELLRNLGPVGGVSPANAERLVHLMRQHFEDAEVRPWPPARLAPLHVNPEDRHVLAAAIEVRADAIVTQNIRHFPKTALSRFGIDAIAADAFLMGLLEKRETDVLGVLRSMSARLTRPPMSPVQVAHSLRRITPSFAERTATLLAVR